MDTTAEPAQRVLTPDQRLRVFVSSTLQELAPERVAARAAIEALQLSPVLFELGARPHAPRTLYQAYLQQSHIFVGIYWQSYGWVAPDQTVSGVEDEFRHSEGMPRLLYVKESAPQREPRLQELLREFQSEATFAYKKFATADDLRELIPRDLVVLITERFDAAEAMQVARASSVPAPPTSFVARQAELDHLNELLLREDVRLVTLSGPAGIGKTRLAIEGARRFGTRYADGVVFVPLEGIQDAAFVAPTIAAALGIREVGARPLEALIAYLGPRSMLLVLDNFEHVIGAASVVSALLERASGLTVIVTSRELLRVRGEHQLPVPPLRPEKDGVTLFAERAAAVQHDFDLATADVPVVAEICRRLDGVPLAIELAAPRMRLLTPKQLLDRVSERVGLTGARDAPPRQQTLDAAIDWSYELLSAEERRLFSQLGVFRGGFTIESASSVCDLPAGADVLELFAALLDKSMIYRLAESDSARFAMLSMIRQYALDRLAQSGAQDAIFSRLADLYIRSAPEAERGLRSVEQRRWKRFVDAEVDNIRAVLAWLAKRRSAEFMTLLRNLWMWFWLSGQFDEWRSWSRRGLESGEGAVADRAWVVGIDAGFAFVQGDYSTAQRELQQARVLFREADDPLSPALLDVVTALLTAAVHGYSAASTQLADSIKSFEQREDAWGVAMSLNVMAWLRAIFTRFEDAADLFDLALSKSEAVGDELQIVMARGNLAQARVAAKDTIQARKAVERAFALLRASGSTYEAHELFEILARCSVADGDTVGATEHIGAADALRESMHVPLWGPLFDRHERLVTDLRAALGDAAFAMAYDRGRRAKV
jgi:predicted ATPase